MTPARTVSQQCLMIGRQLAHSQNEASTTLTPEQVSRIVSATSSAGNLLEAIDKIDPGAPAPPGWKKNTTITPEGRAIVAFEQCDPPKEST
jgi:hypothetical protein